ncbi:MAG: helix-turn-helix transcriptional regulator [Christensenellaceae bacterium]
MKLSKFSENLRQALQGSHMAQSELALKLQTTQQTVSRWLKGINEPDLDTLLKICLYLNETPNSLLGYDEIPKEIFEEYKNK